MQTVTTIESSPKRKRVRTFDPCADCGKLTRSCKATYCRDCFMKRGKWMGIHECRTHSTERGTMLDASADLMKKEHRSLPIREIVLSIKSDKLSGITRKTIRIRKIVKDFLKTGPKTAPQIKEFLNEWHHGNTIQSLVSILSGDPNIRKGELTTVRGSVINGTYKVHYWELKEKTVSHEVIQSLEREMMNDQYDRFERDGDLWKLTMWKKKCTKPGCDKWVHPHRNAPNKYCSGRCSTSHRPPSVTMGSATCTYCGSTMIKEKSTIDRRRKVNKNGNIYCDRRCRAFDIFLNADTVKIVNLARTGLTAPAISRMTGISLPNIYAACRRMAGGIRAAGKLPDDWLDRRLRK